MAATAPQLCPSVACLCSVTYYPAGYLRGDLRFNKASKSSRTPFFPFGFMIRTSSGIRSRSTVRWPYLPACEGKYLMWCTTIYSLTSLIHGFAVGITRADAAVCWTISWVVVGAAYRIEGGRVRRQRSQRKRGCCMDKAVRIRRRATKAIPLRINAAGIQRKAQNFAASRYPR